MVNYCGAWRAYIRIPAQYLVVWDTEDFVSTHDISEEGKRRTPMRPQVPHVAAHVEPDGVLSF